MLSEWDIFSYWKVLAVICRDYTYLTNHGFSAGGVVNPLDALSRSPNHPGRFRQSPGQGSYYAGPAYQSAFVDGVQIGDYNGPPVKTTHEKIIVNQIIPYQPILSPEPPWYRNERSNCPAEQG